MSMAVRSSWATAAVFSERFSAQQLSKLRPAENRAANPNYCPPVYEAVSAQTVAVQGFSALRELVHPVCISPRSPVWFSDNPAEKMSEQLCSPLLAKSRSKRYLTAVTRLLPDGP